MGGGGCAYVYECAYVCAEVIRTVRDEGKGGKIPRLAFSITPSFGILISKF